MMLNNKQLDCYKKYIEGKNIFIMGQVEPVNRI